MKYFPLLLVFLLCSCSNIPTLNIYSWADNFDEEVLREFEKQNNVRINYDVFANNEELLTKVRTNGGSYDLIQPSDYMVNLMIKEGLLEPLQAENIPNQKNILSMFQNPSYDPEGRYSVVYTWGVSGIAYNKKYVKEPITSWADLWKKKYKGKVLLLDDAREVIGMSLKKNGYSNSTQNQSELEKAVKDLKKLTPHVVAFDTDNIKQKMIGEEAWIGMLWSGDSAYAASENPNIAYVLPKEGGTIWTDNYAIPKGAKNKELAEKFINYMLEPKVSAKNYEAIGYSDPNEKAAAFHSLAYRNNHTISLDEKEIARTEWLKEVGKALKKYDWFWTEIKSER